MKFFGNGLVLARILYELQQQTLLLSRIACDVHSLRADEVPFRFKITEKVLGGSSMNLQITDDGKGVKFTAQPVNKAGKTVSLPSGVVPVWTSSDPSVLSVAPDPSDATGLTALGTPVSDGTGINVDCTADLGGGNIIKDDGSEALIDVVPDTTATGFVIQEAAQ